MFFYRLIMKKLKINVYICFNVLIPSTVAILAQAICA